MKEYLVTWQIEITADTPEDAAREAFMIHRDPDSMATVFEVQERTKDGHGEPIRIDIEEVGLGGATT